MNLSLMSKQGSLEVICGSMFSGKSEELIRRVRRATIAHLTCTVFKHSLDNRHTIYHISSHNGTTIEAHAFTTVTSLEKLIQNQIVEVIAIDEAQFFSDQLVDVIIKLVQAGKRVIVAGLDLDFRGEPFGCMSTLMALADSVTKLKAICTLCRQEAHFSQRLVNGKPASYDDALIVVGAQESYQPRCRNCYIMTK